MSQLSSVQKEDTVKEVYVCYGPVENINYATLQLKDIASNAMFTPDLAKQARRLAAPNGSCTVTDYTKSYYVTAGGARLLRDFS